MARMEPRSLDAKTIAAWLHGARERTISLVADLTEEQLLGPPVTYVWPPRWEAGHAAWFVDNRMFERVLGKRPTLPGGQFLYDSIAVPRGTRWALPFPSKASMISYLRQTRKRAVDRLMGPQVSQQLFHHALFGVFHEDMHAETMLSTHQTLGYPLPRRSVESVATAPSGAGPLPGDVFIPGGTFWLGATTAEPFVFDNELQVHPVEIKPFAIARAPVTQAEYASFVDDDGYRRRELWSRRGWLWRNESKLEWPAFWRPSRGSWERRDFDHWVPLAPHQPIMHVTWLEADAYCRWSGRRLPTEAEWEVAAVGEPAADGTGLAPHKRQFPWGDDPPTFEHANLDWHVLGCVDVGALPAGDSAFGCRQMLGNVWEWTSSAFLPYPGFEADEVYPEYSEPWFHTRRVLRGGCWATTSRLIRATLRNFYLPDRDNVLAGFRTCAL
jgi:gamma-glutamyl hercynylcysteine S-oxide synthase